MIYYVLRNAAIFLKPAHDVTLRDIGDLECLFYAVCGKVKECLNDITIRLENHFIAAEDQYTTYKSHGFGPESANAGDFRVTMLSYEAFLYSPEVLNLMKEAFKAKHVQGHQSGSRPVFLDPRNMACGMIFASLVEKNRVALQDEEFEGKLQTMPQEIAALHRLNRYSTGIRMRAKKLSMYKTSLPGDVEDHLRYENDRTDDKRGPAYLEYLDEYSVMSIDSFTTLDSEDESISQDCIDRQIEGLEDQLDCHLVLKQHRQPSSDFESLCTQAEQNFDMDNRMRFHGKAAVEDLSLQPFRHSLDVGQYERPSTGSEGSYLACACSLDCICAPLCAAEPDGECLCIENNLFSQVTKGVDVDKLCYSDADDTDEAAVAEQAPTSQSISPESHQLLSARSSLLEAMPTAKSSDVLTSGPGQEQHKPAACTSSVHGAHPEGSPAYSHKQDIMDVVAKRLFGGSLSIFAIELPTGERVRNTEIEWHNQMRAAMDADRQRYEPDPDWYYPPGATYGRLCIQHINEQHTLRQRILDKTIGNITGKKAMCKPLRLKEGLSNPPQATASVLDGSRYRKPSFMSGILTNTLGRRTKSQMPCTKDGHKNRSSSETCRAVPRFPY